MAYQSLEEIITYCSENHTEFYEAVLADDMEEREVSREESMNQMEQMWNAMLLASENYDGAQKSSSGLVGGQGKLMEEYIKNKKPVCGTFISLVIRQALEMGESNACMKRIVAAPTAGSCGVLPAVLIPYYKEYQVSSEKMIESLYVASGIGQVIASRAFIAGAAGGCQAEIGSASAMAAGAMVSLLGGDAAQIVSAAAIALKGLLGLVCDPVAGLVEVPCVKRNVIGAVNSLTSADMVMAGIASAIPADQVIDAMREVGEKMDNSLKETSGGGLAVTSRGAEIAKALRAVQQGAAVPPCRA